MTAPALNIPIRATGLEDFKRQMSETSALAGTAVRAVTKQVISMNADFLASRGAAGAATLAFGRFLGFLGPIALGITAISDSFKLMNYATDLAKAKITEFNEIAAKANGAGVSTDFYQRFTKSAPIAVTSIDQVSEALQRFREASIDKLGGSDLQQRINELTDAGNFTGNTGLDALAGSTTTEQKLRAVISLIDEAMAKGERLAALDIAGKAFGEPVANALRQDNGYLDEMLKRADAMSKTKLVSDEDVGRAIELKNRMDAAQETLTSKWKPIQDDLAKLGINYHASWVNITEDIAAAVGYATQLYEALGRVPDWFAKRIGGASIWQSITDLTTTPQGRAAAEADLGISSDPKDIGMVTADAKLRAALQNHANVTRGMEDATTIQSAVRHDTSKAPKTTNQDDKVDSAINSLRRHTEQQIADTQAVGLGEAALARFRAEAAETAAVQANGGKETAEQAAQFKNLQQRAAEAADALAKARVNSQIGFGRQTAFLSPEDVQIAEQLRGIYGDDVPRALASSEAAAIRLNNALKGTAEAFNNSLNGPLLDFETRAKSAGSAMRDFERQFIRSLLSMVNQALIIKPLLSGIGGLFGLGSGSAPTMISDLGAGTGGLPFPKFAKGTPNAPGGLAWVGEEGPELVHLPRGTQVIPHGPSVQLARDIPAFADGGGSPAPLIGHQTTIAPAISVNVQGSPGMSPADHHRLGENIAASLEHQVRSLIARELRTQMRPGGILR